MSSVNLGRVQGTSLWQVSLKSISSSDSYLGTITLEDGLKIQPLVNDFAIITKATPESEDYISNFCLITGVSSSIMSQFIVSLKPIFKLKGEQGPQGLQGEKGDTAEINEDTLEFKAVSSGNDIVLNSSETPTEELNNIKQGNKVYSIPQGSGGGGLNLFVHKVTITADSGYEGDKCPLYFISNSNEEITINNIIEMYGKSLQAYVYASEGNIVQRILIVLVGNTIADDLTTPPCFCLSVDPTSPITITSVVSDEISNY